MLNSWQVANVGLFRYGVIRVASAARWYLDNQGFPLAEFFEVWSRWVASALGSKQLTLLVDETKVRDQIGTMVVGVAWEGRGIALAWRSYRANDAAEYPA